MNTIPAWRIPHYFLQLPLPDAPHEPRHVFTYGLLTPEIVAAETLVSPRLLDRAGLPWIVSLADALRSDSLGPSKLGAFLQHSVGISHPGQTSGRLEIGEEIPQITPDQLTTFAADEQQRIQEHYSHHRVPEFLAELREAATERRRPVVPAETVESLATLVARAAAPHTLQRLRSGKGWFWALSFTDLRQRIAVELFELATDRPQLRACRFCDAIFVPRAREANCRFHLWPESAQAGTPPLLPCSPALLEYFDQPAKLKHTRERRRLWTRHQRAATEYGMEHRITKRREEELKTYMDEHRLRSGRRPPRPDTGADITMPAERGQ